MPDWHPWVLLPKQDGIQDGRQTCFFHSKEACFEFILPFNCTEIVISFGNLINHQYISFWEMFSCIEWSFLESPMEEADMVVELPGGGSSK